MKTNGDLLVTGQAAADDLFMPTEEGSTPGPVEAEIEDAVRAAEIRQLVRVSRQPWPSRRSRP